MPWGEAGLDEDDDSPEMEPPELDPSESGGVRFCGLFLLKKTTDMITLELCIQPEHSIDKASMFLFFVNRNFCFEKIQYLKSALS